MLLEACQHKSASLSNLEKAEQWVNERRFQDAITLLENDVSKDADGHRTLLLSSAYAGAAGINLIDSYSFFSGFLIESNSPPPKPRKIPSTPDKQKDNLQYLAQLVQAYLMTLANESHLLLSIPRLTKESRPQLTQAILTAESIAKEQSTYVRARQYLVFLNLIQFGNYMKNVFPSVDFAENPSAIDLICGMEPQSFLVNFEQAISSFQAAVLALGDIQSMKPMKMRTQIQELTGSVESLKKQFETDRPNLSQISLMLNGMQQSYCP